VKAPSASYCSATRQIRRNLNPSCETEELCVAMDSSGVEPFRSIAEPDEHSGPAVDFDLGDDEPSLQFRHYLASPPPAPDAMDLDGGDEWTNAVRASTVEDDVQLLWASGDSTDIVGILGDEDRRAVDLARKTAEASAVSQRNDAEARAALKRRKSSQSRSTWEAKRKKISTDTAAEMSPST